MDAAVLVTAALMGVVVGVCSGMLGVGGGSVSIPIFRLGFGLSALQSTATSLVAIIPTSIAGSITHLRNRTCVPAVGLAAGLCGACTSPVGVWLANMSPSWLVMLCCCAAIAYSAVSVLRKARRGATSSDAATGAASGDADGNAEGDAAGARRLGGGTGGAHALLTHAPEGSLAHTPRPESQDVSAAVSTTGGGLAGRGGGAAALGGGQGDGVEAPRALRGGLAGASPADGGGPAGRDASPADGGSRRRQVTIGGLTGLVAGLCSGYIGLGGGFLMVPMFLNVAHLPMKKASGTSLLAICILAVPGAITQVALGNAQVALGLALSLGSIPGAVLGATLAKRLPDRVLRVAFGAFLLVAVAIMLANEILGL